jgi:hypothetical protein
LQGGLGEGLPAPSGGAGGSATLLRGAGRKRPLSP